MDTKKGRLRERKKRQLRGREKYEGRSARKKKTGVRNGYKK